MQMSFRLRGGSFLLAGLAWVLAACGGADAPADTLAGTRWQLREYGSPSGPPGMIEVLSSAAPTLEFGEDDAVHGSGGCNNFHGTYAVAGDSLTLGPLASTMMFCGEEEGVMDQESAFLLLLQRAAGYSIEGSELHILDGDGNLVAVLDAR